MKGGLVFFSFWVLLAFLLVFFFGAGAVLGAFNIFNI